MTRQTTLELKPDQVQPGDSGVASSIPEETVEAAPQASNSQNLSNLTHEAKRGLGRPREWKPEYDCSPFNARQLNSPQIGTSESILKNEAQSTDQPDETMKAEKEADKSDTAEEKPKYASKKNLRFVFYDDETDTESEKAEDPTGDDWKSIYDKSEMMADSDYQYEVSDDEGQESKDRHGEEKADSKEASTNEGRTAAEKNDEKEEVAEERDTVPKMTRKFQRKLSETSDCTEQVMAGFDDDNLKGKFSLPSDGRYVQDHWDMESGSECSYNANLLINASEIPSKAAHSNTVTFDGSSGTLYQKSDRVVLPNDEDEDDEEDSAEEGKMKAAEWLTKGQGYEENRTPSPDMFDESSSTDCSVNAEAILESQERVTYDPSTDSEDEAPVITVDDTKKEKDLIVPPTEERFDPSSDTEDDEDNNHSQAVNHVDNKGVVGGVSEALVDRPEETSSSTPEKNSTSLEQSSTMLSPGGSSSEVLSTLNTTASTSTGKFDMTEEIVKKLDTSTIPEDEKRPNTQGFPLRPRTPEKSPHEQLIEKQKLQVKAELEAAQPQRAYGGKPAAGGQESAVSEVGVTVEPCADGTEEQSVLTPREIAEMKAKQAREDAAEVLQMLTRMKAGQKAEVSIEDHKAAAEQDSDEDWKSESDVESESESDYNEEKWESDDDDDDGHVQKADLTHEHNKSTEQAEESVKDSNATVTEDNEITEKGDEEIRPVITEGDPGAPEQDCHVQTGEEVDPSVIRHQPEPDLMDRLNRLLGKTMDEIKSADSILEHHKELMNKAEEARINDKEEKEDVSKGTGFFDTALRAADAENDENDNMPDTELKSSDGSDADSEDETGEGDDDNEVFDDEKEAGYISDTEDEPAVEFTPGRSDYSFSESDIDSSRKKDTAHEEAVEDDLSENKRREKEREAFLNQCGRMRFKQVQSTLVKVEKDSGDTDVNKAKNDVLKDELQQQVRYSDIERHRPRRDSYTSTSSSSSYSDDDDQEEAKPAREAAAVRARSSFSSSSSSSSMSSSAWSEDEGEAKQTETTLNLDDIDPEQAKVYRTRQWADEQSSLSTNDQAESSNNYKNMGDSSDQFTQPRKPRPPQRGRPSSATQARRETGGRRLRPMSAQNAGNVPVKQYKLDLNYITDRTRPSGSRVSGTLYKREPKDNETRLKQKYTELLEIVEGDAMPILVGPPTKTGKFSPRMAKSPRERSRSSESDPERKKPSPKPVQDKEDEAVDIEKVKKELDDKYKELEKLLCRVAGDDAVSHRLVERQKHQALIQTMKCKPKGDPSTKKNMDGYQYNSTQSYANGSAFPSRDDPRSRSFSPTDHQLRNSNNPVIKEWLKHKEKCLRMQRAEERQKRRDDKKKEKQDLSEKEDKYKESVLKVDEWMKKKRKEGRRLLKYRNNKENFVNFNRPQSARPEVIMTTTSLEFKRPASATVQRSNSDLPPRRPRSAKPKVSKDEPEEAAINDAKEKDKRRISYEQWLLSKRREDEARKQDEKIRLEEIRRTCQDTELEKIIPDLARNRIRIIESNKKRVDSGVKRADDEANSYPRPKTSTGTKGVKMYRWRPSSAQVGTREEQSMNKYQLVRPNNVGEYGPSPYRLSSQAQSGGAGSSGSGRPGSARNRTQYAEHIWTNFSDNVWKQVNEDNRGSKRPMERPEPMGQAESASVSEQKTTKSGFNIQGEQCVVKPLGAGGDKSGVSELSSERTDKINGTVDNNNVVNGVSTTKTVHETVEKPTTFLETITNGSEIKSGSDSVQHQAKDSSPKVVNVRDSPSSEVKSTVSKVSGQKEATITMTIVNERARIEPTPVVTSVPVQRAPSPEPAPAPRSGQSSPPEVIVMSQEGDYKGTEPKRRGSILKNTINGNAGQTVAHKKKKTVTFGDVQMSDGGERSTSSDSDVERVPVSAYSGANHNGFADDLDNFFLTNYIG